MHSYLCAMAESERVFVENAFAYDSSVKKERSSVFFFFFEEKRCNITSSRSHWFEHNEQRFISLFGYFSLFDLLFIFRIVFLIYSYSIRLHFYFKHIEIYLLVKFFFFFLMFVFFSVNTLVLGLSLSFSSARILSVLSNSRSLFSRLMFFIRQESEMIKQHTHTHTHFALTRSSFLYALYSHYSRHCSGTYIVEFLWIYTKCFNE